MKTLCNKCSNTVHGKFEGGRYVYRHCGSTWFRAARYYGKPVVRSDGAKFGAVIGGLVGLAHGDIGGSAGVAVGAAIGKLFDSDNGIDCPFCKNSKAYPTGHHRYGKAQYQCGNCKRFSLRLQ